MTYKKITPSDKPKSHSGKRPKQASGVGKQPSLDDEINRLIELAARVDELCKEKTDLPDLLQSLDILGKNATRILTLIKAQKELGVEQNAGEALHQALSEMIEDMKKQNRQEKSG